jgi:hypothetical protein
MENFALANDIVVFGVKAESFPAGVMKAWDQLHSMLPEIKGRNFYGISRPEGKPDEIIYYAAVEQSYDGEAEEYKCPLFTLKKGNYISEVLRDFMQDVTRIGTTFQEMLKNHDIDPQGFCVEHYFNDKDVRLMIHLKK